MTLLAEDIQIEVLPVRGYEKILKITDQRCGLKALICIHNTVLGSALGGTRIFPYETWEAALTDGMRLARGMTYKSAVAQTGLGGGKSVIIADPKKDKTPELLRSFGRAVDTLKGAYICAEDYGCTAADVALIRESTPYVVGLVHEKSSGDPSLYTAFGVLRGIQSVLFKRHGSESVKGRVIAVQGLGNAGMHLAELLYWQGAHLIVADVDQEKVSKAVSLFGAQAVPHQEILEVSCDLLAPCALGAILNKKTIPRLRTKLIAGAANNQLLEDTDADELMKLGILYAPDFVINAGGLINVTQELASEGYSPQAAWSKTNQIFDQLMSIYEISEKNQVSTQAAAISLAELRLRYGIGKRETPICLHHASTARS